MFSSFKWSDLFRKSEGDMSLDITCQHEISNDWICVDDAQNCEVINIDEHEVLDEATKQRRRKWQKRLLKGRSQAHNSLPSKAKVMRRQPTKNNTLPQNNSDAATTIQQATSNPNNNNATTTHLRQKLRLAVEQQAAATTAALEDSPPSPNTRRTTKIPTTKKSARSVAVVRKRYIQQPSQRGMN